MLYIYILGGGEQIILLQNPKYFLSLFFLTFRIHSLSLVLYKDQLLKQPFKNIVSTPLNTSVIYYYDLTKKQTSLTMLVKTALMKTEH